MIKVKQNIIDRIQGQAKEEAPVEACGYLAGTDNIVTEVFPMTNADQSPEHFSLDPREQFKVVKEARRKGLSLIAVYHSHPVSPARMSEEDTKLANDPDMLYIIYSLYNNEIKGYRIGESNEIEEISLEIVE